MTPDQVVDLELPVIKWRKSSYTGSGNDDVCVEVARLDGVIGVRDCKDPDGPRLGIAPGESGRLLVRVRRGEFRGRLESRRDVLPDASAYVVRWYTRRGPDWLLRRIETWVERIRATVTELRVLPRG